MTKKRRYTNPKGREVSKVTFPTITDSKIDYTPLHQIAKEEELLKTISTAVTIYSWIAGIIIGSLITYILL
ncbi:hypothetical protein E2605_07820 [Dysgonomonas capnocytophagoides]|uniref:Uncharacterized protein n=1 Tax=Dysgonomonas capnocytophagoides TaxID=45254 RepID=A0A4Y8L238_9BACT|nr:hypothetical protein [Dysgonomonas capnocytophagoides]TFD96719.1 hypothetical protein E2605_07820 [Dysgonomonas capnocytophagoides]